MKPSGGFTYLKQISEIAIYLELEYLAKKGKNDKPSPQPDLIHYKKQGTEF